MVDWISVYWKILTIVDIFAILFNLLLIYLALFQTPKILRTYTTLIINMAITDCLAALCNFFVQQRMIPVNWTICYVSNGVCTYFGHEYCYFGYNVMAHLVTHSNYSLLLSFAYRFYILHRPEPSRKSVVIVILLVYIPSFFQMILYQFARGDPFKIVALVTSTLPEYSFDGLVVSGIEDIRQASALFKILQMTVMTVPIFTAILVFRRKIINSLMYHGVRLTVATKNLHTQLLMALTYQAIIPSIYTISVIMYGLEQLGIYRSTVFENYIVSGLVLIPLLAPVASFVFFTPYKRFLLSKVFGGQRVNHRINMGMSSVSERVGKTTGKHAYSLA